MSISAISFPSAFSPREPAQPGGAALPRLVLLERVDASVRARLGERARDERAGGHVHVIDDADVAVDHRRAADRDVAPDVGAAGYADAARDRAVRADAHVVAHLHLVVELHALLDH